MAVDAVVALRKDHRRRRVEAVEEEEEACTGRSCGSLAAVAVADCVAVCCCPFAVVDILALALLKLPYAAARKLYALGRERVVVGGGKKVGGGGVSENVVRVEKGNHASSSSSSEVLISCSSEASMDDVVLMEFCEVAHLGFGRVSFTGVN